MDWTLVRDAVGWALFGAALSPIFIGVGWAIVEGSLRPRLIPADEIERLADGIARRCPEDPEGAALIEEHAAWYRSEEFEQGKWFRVRKAFRGRREAMVAPEAIARRVPNDF